MKYQNKLIDELHKVISFINNRDVILFTEARWDYIQTVYEYFKFKGIKPYIIGIWNDGNFNKFGLYNLYYRSKKLLLPSRTIERNISKFYNLNILPIREFQSTFSLEVSEKFLVCKLPFDLLPAAYSLTQLQPNAEDKVDDILYNPQLDLKVNTERFNLLINGINGYNWIDISKIKSSNIRDIIPILIRSKIYLSLSNLNLNPVDLYHMTTLGIIPLVTKTRVLNELNILPDYLLDLIPIHNAKFYLYLRYIPEIEKKIELFNDEYIYILQYMNDKLKELYNLNDFITLMYNVSNRK